MRTSNLRDHVACTHHSVQAYTDTPTDRDDFTACPEEGQSVRTCSCVYFISTFYCKKAVCKW